MASFLLVEPVLSLNLLLLELFDVVALTPLVILLRRVEGTLRGLLRFHLEEQVVVARKDGLLGPSGLAVVFLELLVRTVLLVSVVLQQRVHGVA